jgi:hypothetical protein
MPDPTVHVLWLNAASRCDGDTVAWMPATQPSVDALAVGEEARAPR